MPPARLDWPSEVAAPYILHLAPWLCADTRSCNPACFCLPSVYQPGLWWPPRILTVSLQVTRTHDGHSCVRRPLQTLQQQQQQQQKDPYEEKLCGTDGGFSSRCSQDKLCTCSNFAWNQNLTISLAWRPTRAVDLAAHLDWDTSQRHNNGNTYPESLPSIGRNLKDRRWVRDLSGACASH